MKNYKLRNWSFLPSSPSPLSSSINNTLPLASSKNSHLKNDLNPSENLEQKEEAVDKKIQDEIVKSPLLSNDIIESDILSSSSRNPDIQDDDAYDYKNLHQDLDDEQPDYKSVPPDFFNILSTFPLFKQAPKSFHSKVVSKLKLMQYHPQEYIMKEGDPSKSMYWILKGSVSVTSTDGESIYAELASGSFFGEIGILFNRPRTATVVARTKVLVGVLTSDSLNSVLKSYPLIERRIRDEAQERLSMQDKKNKAILPPVLNSNLSNNKFKNKFSKKLFQSSKLSSFASSSSSSSKVGNLPLTNYNPSNASSLANLSSSIPGPSIPITNSPSVSPPIDENLTAADNVDQTISIQEFLKNLPMFSNLPSHIIHRLALGVEPMTYQPFEYIFHKGDLSFDIYFIVNGEVEVIDHLYNDFKIDNILARLKPGMYFGEMAFLSSLNNDLDHYKRSASIRSVTSVELIVVKSDKLKLLCDKYPYIIDDMKNTASQRRSLNYSLQDDKLISFNSSPSNSLPPSRRLSINFLINENSNNSPSSDVSSQAQPPTIAHTPTPPLELSANAPAPAPAPAPVFQQSIFQPNWGFGNNKKDDNSNSNSVSTMYSMEKGRISRSISPISNNDHEINDRKRKSISLSPFHSQQIQQSQSLPHSQSQSQLQSQIPHSQSQSQLQMNVPPLNPVVPSINNFQNLQPGSRRSSFQYMPHSKRIKLATLNGGRRRSSILSNNGPLPDKILLKVFEFLSLPELMKLRTISRRWRQLVYVAPNLCTTLDLKPWNTSIDDKALVTITDFVGSRPQSIDISNCFHITDEGFTYMVNEIGILGKIKKIKMKSNWEVSAMAIMDLTVPSVGRYLEEIDLSNCRKVRDNVLERLIGWDPESISNDAQGESASDHELDLDEFNNNGVGCKNLKILSVGYCKHLSDRIMHHIANHANKRLESLDLTRCTTITDKGFQYWTYRSFSNLKKLSLKDCTFLTDVSIISIANAAPNLEILDLNFCCALSDIAIEVLCLGCQNLRELDLSFCGSAVSDSSLVAISLHLRHLQKLILKGCIRVTRAGIDALLSGCSPLNYINVSQCRNAHIYPGRIPAQKLNVNPQTKSAFVTAGPFQNVIEIVI
ncbi:hypothetical protein HYPBUDRAFT_11897 [Hyphopichia burtonii NRRL Y-1933]|uniref:RNI-like protein n=1 Tax=Hyphopichia burtonii NRRL Y-1933 TaxID=984485 RepID=A0A1E4RJ69_9ASCO|nr:hypothetical protein HYPBUDRAFT_11897 [Hyphopichia burtonii NRRL Y-1933]ODV67318.1 hypothetical protein HYPBUDRAFT_11897 [Hyphopichia burtonii NRRL Y-1933]